MKKVIVFVGVFFLVNFLMFSVMNAQDSKLERNLIVKENSVFFEDFGDYFQALFEISNIQDGFNAKYYTDKVSEVEGVKRFVIQNFSKEIAMQKSAVIRLDKENFKKSFKTAMIILEVSGVKQGKQFLTLDDFINSLK